MSSLKRPSVQVKASLVVTINGQSYGVEPIPPGGFGRKAWRLSGPKGQIYDVLYTHFGIIECDCPHYEYVLKGNCVDMCKHGAALVATGLMAAPDPLPRDGEWAPFDGFTLELGPDPADRAWNDAATRPVAKDDFPTPIEPARRQRRPAPTRTGLSDEDIADATGACG
jgi:hypothetical protein